jgi:hypothetical protein
VSHCSGAGNLRYKRRSTLDSSSTESKPITLWRKMCNLGCEVGSFVTSKRGRKTSED